MCLYACVSTHIQSQFSSLDHNEINGEWITEPKRFKDSYGSQVWKPHDFTVRGNKACPGRHLNLFQNAVLCIWNGLWASVEQSSLGFTQFWYLGNKFKSFLQWRILILKFMAPLTTVFSKTVMYLVTERRGKPWWNGLYRHWDGCSGLFHHFIFCLYVLI